MINAVGKKKHFLRGRRRVGQKSGLQIAFFKWSGLGKSNIPAKIAETQEWKMLWLLWSIQSSTWTMNFRGRKHKEIVCKIGEGGRGDSIEVC